MKILIVSDGFAHFDTTISVYIDRLRGDIEVVTVKSEKSKDPVVIVRKETERVIQYLQKMTKPYVILLDEHANMYTTPEFLTLSDAARETSREVVYVVGGAYGLDRDMI